MPDNQSTHLFFSERGIEISPNITPVVQFLMEIEKEIDTIMSFNKRNDRIRDRYLSMLNLVQFLSDKLKENNIYWEYKGKTLSDIDEDIKYHFPVRSQCIVLFASLEVLFVLFIAYEYEIVENEEIRKKTMDQKIVKKFINKVVLSDKNDYYSKNKKRFSSVSAKQIRELRNFLTHFFSIPEKGLGIIPKELEERALDLEEKIKESKPGISHVKFISPEDLYELIKSANILWLKLLSDDFNNKNDDFKRKINFVINVVNSHGAKILYNKNLNI
jgi:hypothetical protein